MDSYEKAYSDVEALLFSHGIELQPVERNRMMDEFGNVGRGRFADNWIDYLDRGDLRLIVRRCSEDTSDWFEIEIGKFFYEAESVSSHPVRITRSRPDYEGEKEWHMYRHDSSEAVDLLKEIDPDLVPLCLSADDGLSDSLPESFDRSMANNAFFFSVIDKIFATFCAAQNTVAVATR